MHIIWVLIKIYYSINKYIKYYFKNVIVKFDPYPFLTRIFPIE